MAFPCLVRFSLCPDSKGFRSLFVPHEFQKRCISIPWMEFKLGIEITRHPDKLVRHLRQLGKFSVKGSAIGQNCKHAIHAGEFE
jgi:hypothetical protein